MTADAIRHFAYGISDDNPLWVSSEYATKTRLGRLVAPPTFLCSVLYPVLHGAAVSAPLSNLIVELGFEWYEPVSVGDRLTAEARQLDALESRDRDGRPAVLILSEVRYRTQQGIPVARAEATLARVSQPEGELRLTPGGLPLR